jgi:hypothetical protein
MVSAESIFFGKGGVSFRLVNEDSGKVANYTDF